MGCRRYLTPKDIVEGSPNLNLAFVAHIFQKKVKYDTSDCNVSIIKIKSLKFFFFMWIQLSRRHIKSTKASSDLSFKISFVILADELKFDVIIWSFISFCLLKFLVCS